MLGSALVWNFLIALCAVLVLVGGIWLSRRSSGGKKPDSDSHVPSRSDLSRRIAELPQPLQEWLSAVLRRIVSPEQQDLLASRQIEKMEQQLKMHRAAGEEEERCVAAVLEYLGAPEAFDLGEFTAKSSPLTERQCALYAGISFVLAILTGGYGVVRYLEVIRMPGGAPTMQMYLLNMVAPLVTLSLCLFVVGGAFVWQRFKKLKRNDQTK